MQNRNPSGSKSSPRIAQEASRYSRDRYVGRSSQGARRDRGEAREPAESPRAASRRSDRIDPDLRDARSYARSSMSYSVSSGNMAAVSHRGKGGLLLALAAILLVAGIAVFLIFNSPVFQVTVNGNSVTVTLGTTLQKLVTDGHASPEPGDLIAVDGTLIAEGEGHAFEADVNGERTHDPNAFVTRDASIVIEDGEDAVEPFTDKTMVLPYERSSMQAAPDTYYLAPVHLLSSGVDGEQAVRTGNVSGKSLSVITKQPVNEGYSVGNPDVGDRKVVALTFDDGPWPESTQAILKILAQNDARATFFVIGEQIEYNKGVLKRLHAAGNQIASHTYDHASGAGSGVDLTIMPTQQQIDEVVKGFEAIDEELGVEVSHVLRAPGGNYHGSLVETLAPYVSAEIGWNVDTLDWSRPGVQAIVDRILSARPGDIILCHDGGGDRSQTVEALRIALPELRARGYEFVTIDELLSYGVVPYAEP